MLLETRIKKALAKVAATASRNESASRGQRGELSSPISVRTQQFIAINPNAAALYAEQFSLITFIPVAVNEREHHFLADKILCFEHWHSSAYVEVNK